VLIAVLHAAYIHVELEISFFLYLRCQAYIFKNREIWKDIGALKGTPNTVMDHAVDGMAGNVPAFVVDRSKSGLKIPT